MELKVKNPTASSLAEYLGMTKERMMELAKKNTPAFKQYIDYIVLGGDDESNHENQLFEAIVNNCDTLEEVVYLAFHFKDSTRAVLNNTLEDLAKNKSFGSFLRAIEEMAKHN